MTTVGLIGSGHIGGTIARLAVNAGHHVVLSNSRGPETLAGLVAELGPLARAATPEEAAAAGDIVVVTVPFHAYTSVPAAPLAGKTVIDTNNYYPQRDGQFAELDDDSTTASELLQKHLGSAHVVRAFNNIYFKNLLALARPHGSPERTALVYAGDDEGAKAQVAAFFDSIGYDGLDAGPLSEGWRYQRDTAAYGVYGIPEEPPVPVKADTVRAALAKAVRYADM